MVATGSEGTILTSTDGITWALGASGTKAGIYGVAAAGNRLLAVGGRVWF
jgi:hypothetical protein